MLTDVVKMDIRVLKQTSKQLKIQLYLLVQATGYTKIASSFIFSFSHTTTIQAHIDQKDSSPAEEHRMGVGCWTQSEWNALCILVRDCFNM